ncbi:MAG: cardiolipin synthase [Coriobacteriia bacterium]|nr:cardiolipin synthase [Coriobacteriia bacterium]
MDSGTTFGWLGAIITVALYVYWALVILIVISQNRGPAKSLAWILVLMLLPGVGLVLYIFAGRDWKTITPKRKWLHRLRELQFPFMGAFYARYAGFAEKTRTAHEGALGGRLMAAIEKQNFGAIPLPANDVSIYPSGEEYFPVLLDDISRAKRFIHMQYFIWERDELTTQVCDALMERLEAGVEVRILNDFLGNLTYRKDQIKALKDAGAHYGADVNQLSKLNYRNHRKITVIDGSIGHSGGVNIGQEYIDGGKKYPTWRDTGIRFTGPAVGELQKLFAYRWYEVFEESLFNPMYFPAEDSLHADDPLALQVVAQGVSDYWNSSTRAYEIAISGARERVWLQSPYWIPTEGLLDSVVNAALGGADVRLMMTGWPDKKIAFRAAQTYWEPIIKAGGKVYLYMAGFFHAKSIVVDGSVGAIGTMNLDIRSLELHQELMVWMYDAGLARRQEDIFLADLEHCREVTLEEMQSWSGFKRFGDSFARLASNLM